MQYIAQIVFICAVCCTLCYKWRKEYGGLKVDQAKRYEELEMGIHRLRKVFNAILILSSIILTMPDRRSGFSEHPL